MFDMLLREPAGDLLTGKFVLATRLPNVADRAYP